MVRNSHKEATIFLEKIVASLCPLHFSFSRSYLFSAAAASGKKQGTINKRKGGFAVVSRNLCRRDSVIFLRIRFYEPIDFRYYLAKQYRAKQTKS